jgi:sporulation protein YunB
LKFQGQVNRRSRKKKRKLLPFILFTILIAVFLFFYTVNAKLTPIFVRYAEVQTMKIASHVISKAINSKTNNVLDVNEIIVDAPNSSDGGASWKFNTQLINRRSAEIQELVRSHLQQAEDGNLEMLPSQNDIEFDPQAMESQGGVVFFVPIGQATNIPLLGNLGPKIPIRFHVIGDVSTTIETEILPFGINSAYVEVNVLLTVNVQIIVPLATEKSIVKQKIPVAMGLIQGKVPQINYSGNGNGSGNQPDLQIPMPDSFGD